MYYPDFAAAAHPEETGRPFEGDLDASDVGWAFELTQHGRAHGTPRIVAVVARPFNATEQSWTTMEREMYALWKGVTHMDRFTQGFLVYCNTDHKNNTFVESLLENRK